MPDPTAVVGATKWCVFRQTTPTRAVVEAAVNERLVRMKSQSVDLLQVRISSMRRFGRVSGRYSANTLHQFHWQDYSDKGYLEALGHLADLKAEGTIRALGLCNFDSIRTDEICAQLGRGVIVSNQIQVTSLRTDPSSRRIDPFHLFVVLADRHETPTWYGTCM